MVGLLITKLKRFIAASVSGFFKPMTIWQSYKQERGCLMHFARLANTLLKDEESARDSHVLVCNTDRLSNKPFLIWLLTTAPQVQYVATLRCNLSLMACFADINVSRCAVRFLIYI